MMKDVVLQLKPGTKPRTGAQRQERAGGGRRPRGDGRGGPRPTGQGSRGVRLGGLWSPDLWRGGSQASPPAKATCSSAAIVRPSQGKRGRPHQLCGGGLSRQKSVYLEQLPADPAPQQPVTFQGQSKFRLQISEDWAVGSPELRDFVLGAGGSEK